MNQAEIVLPHSATRGALFALAGFATFALHDALIKSLVGYSPFQILFFAVLFSYIPFSVSLVAVREKGHLRPVHTAWVVVRTISMVASAMGAFFAFRHLPLTEAYALLFAMPVVITLLAIPMLGESVHWFRWFAIGLGLVGVLIVLRPGTSTLGAGHLAALVAVLGGATTAATTRKIGADERTATLIIYPLLANVLITGVMQYFVYIPMALVDLAKMASVGILTIIAQYLIIMAYRSAPAALVAPFQYSQMLWAVFYGYIWFGETPETRVYVGAVVIIIAGMLILWRESRGGRSRYTPVLRTRNLRVPPATVEPAGSEQEGTDHDPCRRQ